MSRLPDGDVVFTTTSKSQNSNWSSIFDELADEGGEGLVRKATIFTPITTQRLGQLRQQHGEGFLADAIIWRDNLQLIRNLGIEFRDASRDNQNLVTIVDEAHSLINPEHPAGIGQFGFVTALGPQAYHIIRTSQLSVFLLDPAQGFRERENTTVAEIVAWSQELGAGEPELISLEGSQFRCGGSAEYVTWVESVLDGEPVSKSQVLATAWKNPVALERPQNVIEFPKPTYTEPALRAAEESPVYASKRRNPLANFEFTIFDNPIDLETALRSKQSEGNSGSPLSSYSRKWKTRGTTAPHDLPPSMQDFCETYSKDGQGRVWSRVWNFVPQNGTDYTAFIRAAPSSRMADDPLCEVGCPYAVRGFDYDYVGILWLDDLLWRAGKWMIKYESVHEGGFLQLLNRARAEDVSEGAENRELMRRVTQAYRILLTRALRGAYLWVPDNETLAHLKDSLTART